VSAPTAEHPGAARTALRSDVALAARILAPSWPIGTFIAVNPLGGLEDRPFGEAIEIGGSSLGARGTLGEEEFRRAHAAGRITDADLLRALSRAGHRPQPLLLRDMLEGEPAPGPVRTLRTLSESVAPPVADAVDAQSAKWCAAFLDEGQAGWSMPGRERGFYAAWRELAPRDRSLSAGARERLRALPERAEDALLGALESIGIAEGQRRGYLRAHLARLPGWAAHVRWRGEHGEGIDLTAYLAMRVSYEAALLAEYPDPHPAELPVQQEPPNAAARAARLLSGAPPAQVSEAAAELERLAVAERPLIWLDAYESHYRDALLAGLDRPARELGARPQAQLVCCIDARSEGLRRHLEELGAYDTLGFAGFFAVAIRFRDLAGGAPSALCPVLLEPRNEIRELPAPDATLQAARRVAGQNALAGAEDGFHAAKEDMVAPFALAEASGWAAGPIAAAKTLLAGPYGALRERLQRHAVPDAATVLSVAEGYSFEERALFAEVALTMMGLTRGFAPVVVLCGHGSTTENNPYEAALDCGACGGNRGAPNARTAAAILNAKDVREHLATRGIEIPPDTWFVAGEHDTATDTVTLLDRHLVQDEHLPALDRMAADLREAGARLSAERCETLPGAPRGLSPADAARHVRERASDWAQVFPEWGLAGNAAFIVGPRSITRGLDLGRRAFLHSYEAAVDTDGSALETILTAPLVVAQWINCQYYFSTVDPEVLGAGTKTIHNVVGGIGVLAGHNGDLQLGLPWQSVADGERLIHEPMRLLAIVQAPLERIDRIVERNTILQHLFGNGWVALAAREQPGDPWRRHTNEGWQPWTEEVSR
jgi:uncharacterized protein YbcC (UPF0753/DUF2309 family)